MKIDEMQMSDIETRSAEIEELLKSDDADIDSLTAEVEHMLIGYYPATRMTRNCVRF